MTSEARDDMRVETDATVVPGEQGFQVWEFLDNGTPKFVKELFFKTSTDLRFIDGDKEKGLDQTAHFVLRSNTKYKLQFSVEVAETLLKRSCGTPKVDDASLKQQVVALDAQGKNIIESADTARVLLVGCDLCKADLTKADLSFAYLRWADLSDAKLDQAVLCKARMIKANLTSAMLPGANLEKANLGRANLTSANLVAANLTSLLSSYYAFPECYTAVLVAAGLEPPNSSPCTHLEAQVPAKYPPGSPPGPFLPGAATLPKESRQGARGHK
ncbi:hypothetical protein CYMTET_53601 [Cymbomonas tetramitiformis]|uniref:Pentapeptide repeat-containing protein n=1 Tax=Cymbomonas tetramitiformis TaxID=36881 RepID=A0AAE0EQF3_9CHLO|nr:hypothetical protein CYMTET_53601 [Cymbomonas tetramitiformis]KAK3236242.1 hypothetical protein CYMTET_53601 [Cymbomonas tetramitiformis]